MYCVKCGVKLEDTEKQCPLCNTTVYHPDIEPSSVPPLYPPHRMPTPKTRSKAINGIIIFLFLIPMLISFLADLQFDATMEWFGFVAGALLVGYVTVGLPLWFEKPNPVIFVPCSFTAVTLYLLYICLATGGRWFLSFAFPTVGGIALITCSVVTLLYYLKKGKLYIWGGALMALGAFMILVEFLLCMTFSLPFVAWSIYPLIVFVLLGGILIYLAINRSARETMERKLFF